jgi:hypothetical protein
MPLWHQHQCQRTWDKSLMIKAVKLKNWLKLLSQQLPKLQIKLLQKLQSQLPLKQLQAHLIQLSQLRQPQHQLLMPQHLLALRVYQQISPQLLTIFNSKDKRPKLTSMSLTRLVTLLKVVNLYP